jgi:pyruvate,orthophosphate dikinase
MAKKAKKAKKATKKTQKVRRTKAQTKKKAPVKKAARRKGTYVYQFGARTDGNGTMKPLLGGKGANLAEMCRIGLPVPPGFTITTEVCTHYYAHQRTYPATLRKEMEAGIAALERQTKKRFGDLENPLPSRYAGRGRFCGPPRAASG